MLEIRTFRLETGDYVVVLRGELGAEGVAEIVDQVVRLRGAPVTVDLLRARLVDRAALEAFTSIDATFVAERPVRDALPATTRTYPTLAAALF